jgi:multiple sugar transport system ATP-binding protein
VARVVIEHLTRIFERRTAEPIRALQNVSLTIEDKELMVLVGPSGCGKTTLLRLISGLDEPSGGDISVDGKIVTNVPPGERDMAMVFQNHALYPHMSAYENMAFGLRVRKCPKTEIESRVKDVAEMLGVTDCLKRRPRELSGGERQRVALGRAIVRRPKVFLFDEPLSNLDAQLRVQMRTEIAKLHKRLEATMLYVTHDQVEAMTMGDRIAVMNRGIIQQVGPPMEVYERPANLFVAQFVGSPQMNFFDALVVQKDGGVFIEEQNEGNGAVIGERLSAKLQDESAASLKDYAGKKVVIGIRPEKMSRKENRLASNGAGIQAVVELIEPVGAESFLYLSRGKQSLVFRTAPGEPVEVNDRIALDFDMTAAHFFNPATGNAID